MLQDEDLTWRESPFPGGMAHGCGAETWLMLPIRPELVEMSKSVRTIEEVQTSEHIWWDPAAGIRGDPTVASTEKGDCLREVAVRHLAACLFRRREIRPRRDLHTPPER